MAALDHLTYADAMACLPDSTTTPGAPSVSHLSPLLGPPSLRPRTSLRQLTFADWTSDWDDKDNTAPGMDESMDTALDINGTDKPKQDDASEVDDTVVMAHT